MSDGVSDGDVEAGDEHDAGAARVDALLQRRRLVVECRQVVDVVATCRRRRHVH